jgi:uncharacterized membrane-anchored protein YitT (DUF2179 family)
MTFAQILAACVYLGTPLVIVWRWIVVGMRFGTALVWPMLAALALWLLQAGAFFYAVFYCISGHCNPPPIPEITLYAIIGGAFLGIFAMFVLSALRHRLP